MTIKELRIKHRLSQEEFAKSIGVKRLEVTRWEGGKFKPSLKNIKKIEEVYKVKL